jgi:SHS2 domain-containing protein
MTDRWEHFDHGADIGVRGVASTKAGAFEQVALALMAVITRPEKVRARQRVVIACSAADDEQLLVGWLNRLLYEVAARHMLFGQFRVVITNASLQAIAAGEPMSASRHRPAVEVKGATCTALRVARGADGMWTAQTVVDV